MIKKGNQMNVKLLGIEVDDVDVDEEGAPSGVCHFQVNNKEVQIIVHSCGELDFEGPSLSDEESDALMDAFNSSPKVNKAFPANQYE
jgi:hypothetical protein